MTRNQQSSEETVSMQIMTAMHNLWRKDWKPEAIYLGQNEMRALDAELGQPYPPRAELHPPAFHGVPLHVVLSFNHFYVAGAPK